MNKHSYYPGIRGKLALLKSTPFLFCILFSLLHSNLRAQTPCQDVYLGIDVPNTEHPIFKKAYDHLRRGYKNNNQQDFDLYIQELEYSLKSLKEMGCWEGYSQAALTLAASYLSMAAYIHEFEKSLPYLALIIDLDTAKLEAKSPVRTSAYYYSAQYYQNIYQADSAIKHYQLCLDNYGENIKEKGLNISLSHFGIAQIYLNQKHNIDLAEKHFEIFQSIRNHPDYNTAKDLSRYHEIYKLEGYLSFANKFYLLGDYDKSLSYAYRYRDSAHIYPRNQELRKLNAAKLLGEINYKKGDWETSLAYFKDALNAFENTPEYQLTTGIEDFQLAMGLAKVLIQKGQYETAREHISTGLRKLKDGNEQTQIHLKAEALSLLGGIELDLGRLGAAKEYFTESNKLYTMSSSIVDDKISQNFLQLSKIEQQAGKLKRALEFSNLAYELLGEETQNSPYQYLLLKVYTQKAELYQAIAESPEKDSISYLSAINFYEKATLVLRSSLYDLKREQSLLDLKQNSYKLFEQALVCIWKLYKVNPSQDLAKKALLIIESSKALALEWKLDKQLINTGLSDDKKNLHSSILRELAYYQSELLKLSNEEEFYTEKYADLSQRILELEETFEKDFKEEGNSIQKTMYEIHEEDFFTQLSTYVSRDSLDIIVSYFWGPESSFTLIIESGSIIHFHKIEDRNELQSDVYKFHETLAKSIQNQSRSQLEKEYEELSRNSYSIYSRLFQGIIPNLNEKDSQAKMIILADGPLNLVPFEALLSEPPSAYFAGYDQLPYLLSNYDMTYAPSFSFILRKLEQEKRKSKQGVLAFSYSDEKASIDRVYASRKRGSILQDLPGSFKELHVISTLFGGSFHLGKNANKENFLKHAGDYPILHLSLHGAWDSLSLPYLAFPPNEHHPNGNLMYTYELAGLDLHADLTVLSTCESGLGHYISGEGMQSMANSFLSVGSKAVIYSLWEVDDKASSELMTNFYTNIEKGIPLSHALSMAKRNFILTSDPYKSHPANWASFVLHGKNTNISMKESKMHLPLLIILFASLLTGIFLIVKFRVKQ